MKLNQITLGLTDAAFRPTDLHDVPDLYCTADVLDFIRHTILVHKEDKSSKTSSMKEGLLSDENIGRRDMGDCRDCKPVLRLKSDET